MWRCTLSLALLPVALGCGGKCNLYGSLREKAGPSGVDCGHVEIGADRRLTDACVVDSFNAGKAFFARYELQGTDSHVALGVVRDESGVVTRLDYDGNPSGGGGDTRPVISGSVCNGPRPATSVGSPPNDQGPIACASSTSVGYVCQ